jgi:hypothetical protein
LFGFASLTDVKKYQQRNNLKSLDGLHGLTPADADDANGHPSSVQSSVASWASSAATAVWNRTDALALMAVGAAAGAAVTAAVYRRQLTSS